MRYTLLILTVSIFILSQATQPPTSLPSTVSFLKTSASSQTYFPLYKDGDQYYINMKNSQGEYMHMIPTMYSQWTILSQNCNQFHTYDCLAHQCIAYDQNAVQSIPFMSLVGGQYYTYLRVDSIWGDQEVDFMFASNCTDTQNSPMKFDTAKIYGFLGMGSKQLKYFTPKTGQLSIWLAEYDGADGYIVDGMDSGLKKPHVDPYIFNSPGEGWSIMIKKIHRPHFDYDTSERQAYFDLSTPYIWIQYDIMNSIRNDFENNLGLICQGWDENNVTCEGKEEDFHHFYFSSDVQFSLNLDAYAKQISKNSTSGNNTYELYFKAYNTFNGDPNLPFIEQNFIGAVIFGSSFFKHYVLNFDLQNNILRFYKGDYSYEPEFGDGRSNIVLILVCACLAAILIFLGVWWLRKNKQEKMGDYYAHGGENMSLNVSDKGKKSSSGMMRPLQEIHEVEEEEKTIDDK